MPVNIGPKIGIDGEAQYRKQINQIIQQAKTLASEMKAVTSAFDKNDSSQEKLTAQTKVLNQQIKVQQQRVQQLKKGLNEASQKFGEADTRTLKWQQAVDTASALNNAGDKAIGFGDVLKANVLSQAIISGVRELANGFKQVISSALDYNATIEGYQTSFEVMTGSAEEAQKVVEKLTDFAAKTPFEMQDLADTTQLLMNYGFTAEEAMERMSMLGDISQGSAEKMNRIATAYGQMSSAGKVQLEDIKQMIEAGFNPLQEISQTTGESMESLYERISDGALSIDEITASMQRSTSEGGKYFQSMDKQSQTFNGQLSTLRDNINQTLGGAFQGVSDKLTQDILPAINEAIGKIDVEAISEKIEGFLDFLMKNGDTIAATIAAIGYAFVAWNVGSMIQGVINKVKEIGGILPTLIAGIKGVNTAMSANPIGFILTLIGLLVGAIAYLWNNCQGFRDGVIAIWEKIKEVFSNAVKRVQEQTQAIIDFFKSLIDAVKQFFQDAVRRVQEQTQAIIQFFVNLKNAVVDKVLEIKDGIVNGFQAAIDFITSLPGKALQWGKDFIQGLIDGIKSKIGAIVDSVRGIADTITSWLHFSKPDIGPLREYEKWMPDFMSGMAKGIRDNTGLVTRALEAVSTRMAMTVPVTSENRSTIQRSVPTISINVYGTQGQDVNELADIVMYKIQSASARREGVFA